MCASNNNALGRVSVLCIVSNKVHADGMCTGYMNPRGRVSVLYKINIKKKSYR